MWLMDRGYAEMKKKGKVENKLGGVYADPDCKLIFLS